MTVRMIVNVLKGMNYFIQVIVQTAFIVNTAHDALIADIALAA
jgi:hypothetical protein